MEKLRQKVGKTYIKAYKIQSEQDFETAKKIRYQVFVIGQNVPAEEEIDAFEEQSFHFLAMVNNIPCGAARWRFTENGIKLERFAVLEKYRGMGAGSALVEAVIEDIKLHSESSGKSIYLHAQVSAMKLYSKFGFKQTGKLFQECEIDHYKMIRS